MIKQGRKVIVNCSSVADWLGFLLTSYVASKHGVIGLTKTSALNVPN
jgi:NAD(P)-dependent dehydrogenase (short-subunit alcohol dehydrogenase family)